MKLVSLSVFIALVFSGCIVYPSTKVHKNEDHLLNCKKLTTQIADLMDENDNINKDTGFEISSLTLWAIWPVFGGVNQVSASNARGDIDERFNYLIERKQELGCTLTYKEKLFLDDKGRVSDKLPW